MSDPFIGEIKTFGFSFPPQGWAQCNGALLPIPQNTALFSLLGTIYGGDGETTFAIPDLRGRAPISAGTGPGLTPRSLGQRPGSEAESLSEAHIPAHTHNVARQCVDAAGNEASPKDHHPAQDASGFTLDYSSAMPDSTMAPETTEAAGGGQAHPNMQPSLVVNFSIALVGVFPSPS